MVEFTALPLDLPRPIDDGGCDHLPGLGLPHLSLPASTGRMVDLSSLPPGRTVIYCYPMTGVPGRSMPDGWDLISGARGCTPQACAFRDHHREIVDLGSTVYGLSAQTTAYQCELADRLHLPFELLSDADLRFATALRLPTFDIEGMRLIKRLTLVVRDSMIEHVFYPVFPPDESANQVVQWLSGLQPPPV